MKFDDFLDLMKKRQSCRSFDYSKPVSKEDLVSILEAGRLSPSACNSQPYEVFVAQGENSKIIAEAKMVSFNKFIDECNTFLVIAEDNYSLPAKIGSMIKKVDFKAIDIGILTANLVNAASALNLETCILGVFDEKRIQKLIDRRKRIRLVIALGYPKEGYPLREKTRKDFDDNMHFLG
ncbi:nitroreductase family protein [Treponema sp. OMZ 792]|uniref:nitroreductase family protein n=1 Tax=unclassified Treponema TaxID=2638727 RepID=UPI0020A56D0E|nr:MULTISPECIES: nitroreductase family protein [unclassified Treponema]UTC75850.1 nitroreductase family protein [Treponema sp. OMZ 792]UTC78343.1 nitroreductase [Treponema sp. OMZ 799]UTC79851.1 nitroreductase [Treponema sp. OMZ 798]